MNKNKSYPWVKPPILFSSFLKEWTDQQRKKGFHDGSEAIPWGNLIVPEEGLIADQPIVLQSSRTWLIDQERYNDGRPSITVDPQSWPAEGGTLLSWPLSKSQGNFAHGCDNLWLDCSGTKNAHVEENEKAPNCDGIVVDGDQGAEYRRLHITNFTNFGIFARSLSHAASIVAPSVQGQRRARNALGIQIGAMSPADWPHRHQFHGAERPSMGSIVRPSIHNCGLGVRIYRAATFAVTGASAEWVSQMWEVIESDDLDLGAHLAYGKDTGVIGTAVGSQEVRFTGSLRKRAKVETILVDSTGTDFYGGNSNNPVAFRL